MGYRTKSRRLTNEEKADKIEDCIREIRKEFDLRNDNSQINSKKLTEKKINRVRYIIDKHKIKPKLICAIIGVEKSVIYR